MARKNSDPKADAARMASLSIVWGVLAGVAYLGLVAWAVDRLQQLHVTGPSVNTNGLRLITVNLSGVPAAGLLSLAIEAIPYAIAAVIILAILARVFSGVVPVPVLLIVAAVIGLVGTLVLFLNRMNLSENRTGFLIAIGTIVGVWILVRLERQVRRLGRRNPAVASLLLTVLVIVYLVASNVTTIPALILGEIDVWLALVAFVIVLYAAIRMLRLTLRLQH